MLGLRGSAYEEGAGDRPEDSKSRRDKPLDGGEIRRP
jgi:hypothetical protein